jgi:hypothetical protein
MSCNDSSKKRYVIDGRQLSHGMLYVLIFVQLELGVFNLFALNYYHILFYVNLSFLLPHKCYVIQNFQSHI